MNSLPQEQSALMAQQQQAYAMMTAGMMADQVPPGLYQQANHQNGLAAAMNIGALQNQGIQQHINAHEQFRRHSIQALGSAQMQNQMQNQVQNKNQLLNHKMLQVLIANQNQNRKLQNPKQKKVPYEHNPLKNKRLNLCL